MRAEPGYISLYFVKISPLSLDLEDCHQEREKQDPSCRGHSHSHDEHDERLALLINISHLYHV